MCRILFLKWTNKKKALKYIDAFYKAWFDDPHLQNALQVFNLKKIKKSHNFSLHFLIFE